MRLWLHLTPQACEKWLCPKHGPCPHGAWAGSAEMDTRGLTLEGSGQLRAWALPGVGDLCCQRQ